MKKMKWYEFHQNNSGGIMYRNENIADEVLIEASSAISAERKARKIGIYFDGVEKGIDCDCCGDRWKRIDCEADIVDIPVTGYASYWIASIEEYGKYLASQYHDDVILYYSDGRKTVYCGRMY